jgi:EmrB/QacA subfamily drug resistance transporter
MTSPAEPASLPMASRRGRLVLLACVLSSGAVMLDGTVVNIALVRIGEDLDAGFSTLQWTINAYLLMLSAFVLVGGALADLLGRRRVFVAGVIAFGAASALCGLAQTGEQLVVARALQGVAGALVAPGALSVVNAVFSPKERGKAIGALTGLTSVAIAAGPFIGGWLVDLGPQSWRLVFLVNLPITVCAVLVARYAIPDLPATRRSGIPLTRQLDLVGAGLASVGLLLLVLPLIEWSNLVPATRLGLLVIACVLLYAFYRHEQRTEHPMMPTSLWRYRTFVIGNSVGFVAYGVLGVIPFLLVLTLQTAFGYTALQAGLANLPPTILLLLFAASTGRVIARFGGRAVLTAGCLFASAGLFLLLLVDPSRSYWTGVLPGMLVWGVGLVLLIAPLANVSLGDVPRERSGIAAGVNSAFGRVAGLVAVAALPLVAGFAALSFDQDPTEQVAAFHRAVAISGVIVLGAALLARLGLPRPDRALAVPEPTTART